MPLSKFQVTLSLFYASPNFCLLLFSCQILVSTNSDMYFTNISLGKTVAPKVLKQGIKFDFVKLSVGCEYRILV